MPMEKTQTKGIYKSPGKKGKVAYVVMYYIQAPDPLSEKGWKWKPKGKRFSKYQDALNFKVTTQSEVKSGNHVEPSHITVEEIAKEWLESGKPDWKIQTYNGHHMQVTKYIVPSLGHLKAGRLSAGNVRAAGAEWQKQKSISAKTVNKLFATMNRICEFAISEHDVKLNPMDKVKRLKHRSAPEDMEALALGEIADHGEDAPEEKPGTLRAIRPDEVYSALELKKIIDASTPGLERAFLMTAIFTGLRHGELCGLRWSVVDLKKGSSLFVNRSLTALKSGPILERPKTTNAYRRLDLAQELRRELTSWKIACPPNPNDLVFVNAMGKPVSRKTNNDMLKSVCERAGVRALSMNNLRHSFASQHLIAGTPPLQVSHMMGHSDPGVTLKVYSRWTDKEESRAEAALAGRIFGAEEAEERGARDVQGQKN
jgi:integrase